MAEQFTPEWARGVIDSGVDKAKSLIGDQDQVNELLQQLQEKLKGIPDTAATAFNNVPLMASMVKSYVTREYTEVSPKVVISLVSAFLYLVKRDDIINDGIPVIGMADDLAVATIVMAINEPELNAYAAWREAKAAAAQAPVKAMEPQAVAPVVVQEPAAQADANPVPGAGGDVYVPPAQRDGAQSIVWFTRDLSAEGLRKAFAKVSSHLYGNVAVKLHTGEKDGPNIIPRDWVAELIDQRLPNASIVETNTYYDGDRYTTEQHRETIAHNGWTFCPVDIMDEEGVATLPVEGGKWFTEMHVGDHLLNYDSLLALTHFKGHVQGGFGGSNKNIGIGCADGRVGKKEIHTWPGASQWSIATEEFMERMTESTKSVIDHFGNRVVYVNVMRNMSVSCDCEGTSAMPVVTPDVGILASTDICAIDSACIDLVYTMTNAGLVGNRDLVERIESRHGLRQLSYMHEIGMGNWLYQLVDLDNDEKVVSLEEAVAHVANREG